KAEFAIHVAQDWQHRGLGRWLLDKLVASLRMRGTSELVGQCVEENVAMAALARRTGFEVRPIADGVVSLRLALAGPAWWEGRLRRAGQG
ncbi:MAG TPA: GNAT family N-acetyltransferase, partial [Ramlibacter sp.]